MRTLIIYNSVHNNNTEKIAKAIAGELEAEIVRPPELNHFDLHDYDLVGLGSGIYRGEHHSSILDLVDKLENIKYKRFFIFSTRGFENSGENDFHKTLKEKISNKGGNVMAQFSCLGFANFWPLSLIGGKNKGKPNEDNIEKAREFARELRPKVLTLCLTLKDNAVLLGMKKRGFGEGRWNGFGGKVEKGETLFDAAKREMVEESGLIVEEMEERGSIDFHFMDTGKLLEVHMFEVLKYSGEITETEEMKPQWFNLEEIPFHSMWADDPYWFPLFFKKKKFKGRIIFENNDKILNQEIKILD